VGTNTRGLMVKSWQCWPVMLFTHVGVPNHSTMLVIGQVGVLDSRFSMVFQWCSWMAKKTFWMAKKTLRWNGTVSEKSWNLSELSWNLVE
jgi:hypothetical protein